MALLESGEMYLETIYTLLKSTKELHAIDIVEKMEYSKPSVSRALSILKRDGYVTVDEKAHIHLTEKGIEAAERVYQRHVVLTSFLTHIGVDESIASNDACKIEHVISDETLSAIKSYMESKQ